jgi:septum formation protein
MTNFILASQSPRRKSLLEWAEIKFDIVVSDTDETYPSALPIEDVPVYIAQQKAIAVAQKLYDQTGVETQNCIIAADTVVVLDQNIKSQIFNIGPDENYITINNLFFKIRIHLFPTTQVSC